MGFHDEYTGPGDCLRNVTSGLRFIVRSQSAAAQWFRLSRFLWFGAARAECDCEECDLSQTIFLLEDDPDISRLVQYHLEGAGFRSRPTRRSVRS